LILNAITNFFIINTIFSAATEDATGRWGVGDELVAWSFARLEVEGKKSFHRPPLSLGYTTRREKASMLIPIELFEEI
jgi:hypothetical protein